MKYTVALMIFIISVSCSKKQETDDHFLSFEGKYLIHQYNYNDYDCGGVYEDGTPIDCDYHAPSEDLFGGSTVEFIKLGLPNRYKILFEVNDITKHFLKLTCLDNTDDVELEEEIEERYYSFDTSCSNPSIRIENDGLEGILVLYNYNEFLSNEYNIPEGSYILTLRRINEK